MKKELKINDKISIPENELHFKAVRSSGPGGQHVNKVNTKVILSFDVEAASTLTSGQKDLIRRYCAGKMSHQGVLQIANQSERSQYANREKVKEKFILLLRRALKKKKPRIKTQVPVRTKELRLAQKRIKSALKKGRAKKISYDE